MTWLILLTLLVCEAVGVLLVIVMALVACTGRALDVVWGDAHSCHRVRED